MAFITVAKSLPKDKTVYVAVSGGVDSMVALHFLKRKHNVEVLHYVHSASAYAEKEKDFVVGFCEKHGIVCHVEYQQQTKEKSESQEENWRKARYEFFRKFDLVVTGHTLDDAVEWYLFSCFNGQGKFMEYSNDNVVRPFILTEKQKLLDYATQHGVEYIHDVTNDDVSFAARNRIRNNILPEVLKVNLGIYKVVKKRIIEKMKDVK